MALIRNLSIALVLSVAVSGCATWSNTTVDTSQGSATTAAPTNPAQIIVTKEDITDRQYEVIGDIKATVNKTTIFHPDPTPALVDEQLRAKAAEAGADAVILVRYGTVGVSLVSWGSLDGQGRAVKFVQ